MALSCAGGVSETTAVLVAVAFAFVFIEYLAGIMLHGIPRVRHIGSDMAENAITSAAMLVMVTVIALIANAIMGVIFPGSNGAGGAYAMFDSWLTTSSKNVQNMILALSSLSWALSSVAGLVSGGLKLIGPSIGVDPLAVVTMYTSTRIGPWLSAFETSWILYNMLRLMEAFFECGWLVFVAWGALIYSLPWRIGRVTGGSIMMSALVFHVGLPFMPFFVQGIQQLAFPDLTNASLCQRFISYFSASGSSCDFSGVAVGLTFEFLNSAFAGLDGMLAEIFMWLTFLPALYITFLFAASASLTGAIIGGAQNIFSRLLGTGTGLEV